MSSGKDIIRLKLKEHVELIKFLEDAPLTSFRQHWLEPPDSGGGAATDPISAPVPSAPSVSRATCLIRHTYSMFFISLVAPPR